jgi:DNA-binding transcriptional LysR family regulator
MAMDRLKAMSMLVAVTETGSLSATARRLRVPLATLSRKLSDLEARLGARLLTRTTRKLTLTDAGVAYVAAARRILEQVEEAEHAAAGEFVEPKGELVVTAPVMFGRLHVLPVVAEFLAAFPAIDVRLVLSDRHVNHFRNPRSGAAIDVPIRPRLSVTTTEAAADAASLSVGVTRLLHYQAVEAIQRGALQIILEAYEPEPSPVHLVHVSRGQMPLKMRRFLDLAAPRLREAGQRPSA